MLRTTAEDGTEIAYEATGDGPPVVLVHGITDSHRDWAPVVERLSPTHRCIALDLRGHGESGDAADYSALSMATDIAAVVAAEGLDAPVVVGHSLGAVAVSAFAASVPTAAIVNVDQSLRFGDFADALRPLEAQLRDPATFHDTLALVFDVMTGTMLDNTTKAALDTNRLNARQEVVMGVWDLVFASTDADLDATVEAVGAAITSPYLSLHGLDPGEGYAEWLQQRLPSAVVEEWPEHGHYPHLVDPDRFTQRLLDFTS
jgi:pimeloyl-ACP methyl ester carboxylesterase